MFQHSGEFFSFSLTMVVLSLLERICDDDLWVRNIARSMLTRRKSGIEPELVLPSHDTFLRAAQIVDPHAKLWYGDLNEFVTEHGGDPRLYVCQAPNTFMCVLPCGSILGPFWGPFWVHVSFGFILFW